MWIFIRGKEALNLLYLHVGNTGQRQWVKWTVLFVLVLQNSAQSILMKYSRQESRETYISSTAVFCCEVVKLAVSLLMLLQESRLSIFQLAPYVWEQSAKHYGTTIKLTVPAFLYAVQNNLQYAAITNLHPAIFQLLYQMKLPVTALLSVVILHRNLSVVQWVCLIVLSFGVAVVQTSGKPADSGNVGNVVGCLAVLVSCITSGLAAVYFEKTVKATQMTFWLQNVHMCVLGLVMSLAACWWTDSEMIARKGFFYAYTPLTWGVIVFQAGGGLTVAMVVKYADSILKGLATSLSIVISCVASAYLFHLTITAQFLVGSVCIISSVLGYAINPKLLLPVKRSS